jgi:hypothetical protein
MVRKMIDQTQEIRDRMAVECVCNGSAEVAQLDEVLKVSHLLRFAAEHKQSTPEIIVCDMANDALSGIVERYKKTKKVRCTGEEAKALRALVDVSEDFWRRQSGQLRDACIEAANAWYEEINEKRENNAKV